MRRKPIKQRIITAIIVLPVVLFLTLAVPGAFFVSVVTMVAAVALWELYSMVMLPQRWLLKYFAIVFGALQLPLLVYYPELFILVMAILFIGFAIYFLFNYQEIHTVVAEFAEVVLGWLYVPLLLTTMVLLHELPLGKQWVLLVLIMTMACDSCAYFVGSAWGKRRLYPAISPKKSVEGALGGLLGAVIVALSAHLWLLPATGWVDCLMVGIFAAVFGQLGDLFESMIKRNADIKDSGTIFPGHGGMLDRIDSLLFSFPAVYAYVYLTTVMFN